MKATDYNYENNFPEANDYNIENEEDKSLTRIEEEYNNDTYNFFPDASF